MGETCVVIPARGGSKRIKGKNLIDFDGKPMLQWTIEAAQAAGMEHIWVSSEDDLILTKAHECGAQTFLRTKCADDYSTVTDATLHTLAGLEKFHEMFPARVPEFDTVIQLLPNCPLRTGKDIRVAMDQFRTVTCEFQLSAFEFGFMNPWWAMFQDGTPLHPKEIKMRSQDLRPLYCPTGAIWIADIEALKRAKTFYGKGYNLFIMPWQRSVDIDTLDDLAFALAIKQMGSDPDAV